MRGYEIEQQEMFLYGSIEGKIPENHPLRKVKQMIEPILTQLSWSFDRIYSPIGRPSIPPEQLLRGELLRILYSIKSERQLMEHLQYNLLFKWFVGLSMNELVWDASSYSKNRDRLMAGDIAHEFFDAVKKLADEYHLLSNEHFTVDGTLLEAVASIKSFRPKNEDEPPEDDSTLGGVDFKKEQFSNKTHQSKTDPQCRLFRKGKGKEAKLRFSAHVIMDNRHGLVSNDRLCQANGTAERDKAMEMMIELNPTGRKVTLGGDKNYDTHEFVTCLRALNTTPHVAQNNTHRKSAIDMRTTRHSGYEVSQRKRKRVEQVFAWDKATGRMDRLRHIGQAINQYLFTFTHAAYNLIRMTKLIPVPA